MIAHWVVTPLSRAQRTDPPAGEHIVGEKALGDERRAALGHDAGPETVSRVGGDDLARALRAVERERIEALVFHPEVAVEAVEEILRLSPQRALHDDGEPPP